MFVTPPPVSMRCMSTSENDGTLVYCRQTGETLGTVKLSLNKFAQYYVIGCPVAPRWQCNGTMRSSYRQPKIGNSSKTKSYL